jgi:hypothetical protein
VTVDAMGVAGLFTPSGDILYTNSSNALMRYATATMVATPLSTGVVLPLDLSPDGNWLQAASGQNPSSGLFDLFLVSATTPGPAERVVNTTSCQPFGFTADSNYSLFGTNFPTNFGWATYNLQASKTTGGGAPSKVLAAVGGALFTTGSKVVSNTNQSKSTGAADIVELDLSTTAAPKTLVSQADPNLFQTSTKAVVYSWYCDENAQAGVWMLTPP